MRYRLDPGTLAGLFAVMAIAIVVLILTLIGRAHAVDNGQFEAVDPNVRSWFKSVRSPHGVPCCDIADGHRVQEDIRGDHYWAFFEGEWREIPPEAVVYNVGNPVGEPVVWYVRQTPTEVYIRCYVPGGGV